MTQQSNIKKSWRDVTINEYFDLRSQLESAESDYEKDIIQIAFVNNMTVDDVLNCRISEVKALQQNCKWMANFEINPSAKFKKIDIEGQICTINTDLHSFTVAQYIDFQSFYPKRNDYLANLLACFIIPKKCKYGEGYDVQKLISQIKDSVDIVTANEIIFFFLKQYLRSMRVMLTFFKYQMKILKWWKPKKYKTKIEELENQITQLEKNILVGSPLWTT